MNGQTIGRKYEIIQPIGIGGMGIVYEARHTGTGRHVALKMISAPDLEPGDPRLVRFQREARAAGAIETQHIAQIFDIDEDPATGAPFIVMELLRGEDMQR